MSYLAAPWSLDRVLAHLLVLLVVVFLLTSSQSCAGMAVQPSPTPDPAAWTDDGGGLVHRDQGPFRCFRYTGPGASQDVNCQRVNP